MNYMLPKDRKCRYSDFLALSWMVDEHMTVEQIAHELRRNIDSPNSVRWMLDELPKYRPDIDAKRAIMDDLAMSRGSSGLNRVHHAEAV